MADVSQIKLPNGDTYDIKDDSASTATNWVNGSATNSVRTTGSAAESSSYIIGANAVAEGYGTKASGNYSHAEGQGSIAKGESSHAEGVGTTANGSASHAEGSSTTASNSAAHAEGAGTTASGQHSHAEGAGTEANSDYSHAEGASTLASGPASHAEGSDTTASGSVSHAEGQSTTASSQGSHAEGISTTASGIASHAEGDVATASGLTSHAEGSNTIANHMAQHVFGRYNIADPSTASSSAPGNYVEIVGNGANNARSNARTLDWSGNEVLAGKLTVGVAGTNSMDVATVGQIPTVPSNIVNTITTTAGAHTAITSQKGNVSFNVPTTAAHVGIKFGYTTSGNNRAVLQDGSGNLYVTQKDDNTNTTYTLTNALASHKFTWTFTPSSGSATTTTAELVQGTGITLTDDTSNKKITIANAGVTSITTAAGAHSVISSKTGAVSFNVPTKTSHLTNDSGFITNAGVTGVKGNSESTYRTGQVNLTAANIGAAAASHTHSANDLNGGYINIHPENSPIIIPFMHNDIAYLLKRGGSASITYDGTTQTVDLSNCFDGSGSYWTVSGNISTIVIELTLHKQFTWTNTIYVDFGSASWRAKSIKIEAMNTNYSGDTWATKTNVTNYSTGHITCAGAHTPSGASNAGGGFNKLRFTFSDFNSISTSGGSFRIAQIGVYNYGSMGLRETYMSRGADDYVFRDITPNSNNTYNLGSSSNKWANIYATTFSGNLTGNVTGNVSGTAGGVAWSNVSSKPTATGSKVTGITASTTATKTTLGTAFTIPNVTAAGSASTWVFEDIACDDITSWSAGSGSASISGAVDGSDSTQLNITISHTHTAPSLSYTARTVSSKKSGANGTAPTLGTAFTVPNVTGNISATVSITDNGHTHSIS